MSESSVYLRKPAAPKAKPKKGQKPVPAHKEISHILFRYRAQLLPFLVSLWIFGIAVIVGPIRFGTVGMAVVCTGTAYAAYRYGHMYKLAREVERRYAAACATAAGLWIVYGTWSGDKPGPRAILVLLLGTCIMATPWWHHRRIRGGIEVVFRDVPRAEKQERLNEARALINEWTAYTSAAQLHGAKLVRVAYDEWSVTLRVKFRRGGTVGEFTERRLEKLESAFGEVKHGSARVEKTDKAGWADIRYMLADPHEEAIEPPEDIEIDLDTIPVGIFETGATILFALVNTLIAGMTGAGKSGVVNALIRALSRIPNVAILGVDMKPGAPELGPWRDVMHALATNPDEARVMLNKVMAGLTSRGETMRSLGWRKWQVSRGPIIVLIIDEVQQIKKAGLGGRLDDIAALIRAFGGVLVVATQHPTNQNVSAAIKANCPQRIGLKTEGTGADRVIFGESATRDGWRTGTLPGDRPGSLFIRSPKYKAPVRGRAYWMDDDRVAHEALTWSPARTAIDESTWTPIPGGPQYAAAGALPAGVPTWAPGEGDVVDAVVVDDDPLERVLNMIGRGVNRPAKMMEETGWSRPTTGRHLKSLKDQGLVQMVEGKRGTWERV